MQTRITPEEIQAAARQLAKSDAGRDAMTHLLPLLEQGRLDLGFLDQRAFLALLGGAWLGQPAQVCTAMRAALSPSTSKA